MREPELVFKAQQAAAALERAWERWREVHGTVADPMPAISSYVGYSLEEPWGQPRVVFGLSADDAQQLVALLDRHDCVGPVHKTIAAGQGGRELGSQATGRADQLASVPRQAPSLAADSVAAQSHDPELGRGLGLADTAEQGLEQDGPVFRQLMAAVRNVSGAHVAVHAGAAPGAADAVTAVGVLDVADVQRAGVGDLIAAAASPSGNATSADDASDPGDSDDDDDAPAASSGAAGGGEGAKEAGSATAAETAHELEFAADGQVVSAAAATKDAGIILDTAQGDADNARPDESPEDPPGELTDGPGPLAQAASAARVEAEARIRAAMVQAKVAEPSASGDPDGAGPRDADPGEGATNETKPPTTLESAPPPEAAPSAKRGPAEKSPGEAGLEAPPVAKPGSADESVAAEVEAAGGEHAHDISASLGRPESDADDGTGPAIGTFGFGSDLVGSVGSYHEPGNRSDQSQDRASSGYARRNRGNRTYSIPRLSKSRRAGVSPGA